jgi:hypothetical protein
MLLLLLTERRFQSSVRGGEGLKFGNAPSKTLLGVAGGFSCLRPSFGGGGGVGPRSESTPLRESLVLELDKLRANPGESE